ncbi:MAG: 3-hydroxyacyl-ACP dehydratase [Campylobacterota bacterium]|nr:3-hydroxyacyl-ACP dehydratase [Campylobacterota bacterium]
MLENLYSIIEQDEKEVKVKLARGNHPIFKAHFPENPILPGFIQIEMIAEILNDDIAAIGYSKFLSHILPGDTIVYIVYKEDKKRRIKIFRESKKVSEMTYESK